MSKVQDHNREVIFSATNRSVEMQCFPSKLEERMIGFLNNHQIDYEFQKIFYIREKDNWISRYYIADFYIPKTKLIIEVDGKFHDKQKQHDKTRTKTIQKHYPDVRIYRWRWHDFDDPSKVDELLSLCSCWNP